jgi:hypothetical protein
MDDNLTTSVAVNSVRVRDCIYTNKQTKNRLRGS